MLGMERARCGACAECTRVVRCLTTETGTGSEMSENCVEITISLMISLDVFSLRRPETTCNEITHDRMTVVIS